MGFMDKKIIIPKGVVVLYYKRLSSRVYKILPILEGKDLKGKVVFTPEIAKENFKKHLSKLLLELYGNSSVFFTTECSLEVIGILKGILMTVSPDNKDIIRTSVFDCMSLLEKGIKKIEEGDDIEL